VPFYTPVLFGKQNIMSCFIAMFRYLFSFQFVHDICAVPAPGIKNDSSKGKQANSGYYSFSVHYFFTE